MPKESLKDKLDGNELDLSLNNLEVVPVKELLAIPKATHLDLSCNLLVKLPDSFCSLTHLVKIDLSKNQLTELPQDFGRLENLQHLDLLGNGLTSLPESFSLLKKLKWLDLKDNPLEPGLKKNAGDCLDEKQCLACAKRILLYMKELSSQMERKRQLKLKEQRDKYAKEKAEEDEEVKRLRDEKKAEKERKKKEQQAKKAPKETTPYGDHHHIQGDETAREKEKRETKKDKTGRGFCSCFMMIASILVLGVALVVGLVIHCSTSLKDRYCRDYFNPAQTQVMQVLNKTQQQATGLYAVVSQQSGHYFEIVSAKATEMYEVSMEVVHGTYVSAIEMWEKMQEGEGESQETGKT